MLNIKKTVSTILLCAFTVGSANAVIIPSDLEISGQVSFDSVNSAPVFGNASQTATMTLTDAGVSTTTTVANVTATGSNPLGDVNPLNFTFTDFGDGIGIDALVSGGANTAADDFFFDFAFALSNTSATDTYQIFFELMFDNNADADGGDAFVDSEVNLFDNALSETFATDLTSDTRFGDQNNGVALASSGAALNDSGIFNFDFTLAALASDSFSGLLKIDGEDFAGGSFTADSTISIRILRAENLTITPPPTNVPEPGSVLLLLSGLIALGIKRRVSR